jgi:hypothetical protein
MRVKIKSKGAPLYIALCPEPEKRTMRESEAEVGISGRAG